MSRDELPLPEFYDPAAAARWDYRPDQQAVLERALRWRRLHGLRASGSDARRVLLLLVDVQKDFCFPEGTLYVGGRSGRGAVEDSDRLARFIYRNLGRLTGITCTMDTHFPFQIFSPAFWHDPSGAPPPPHREITTEDIARGEVRPNPEVAAWLAGGDEDWLRRQVVFYCRRLEEAGRYRLYLWPPHCLLGSDGHALVGAVHEARLFHAYARSSPAGVEVKGGHALTENYSVLSPEVLERHDGGRLAEPNTAFVDTLLSADAVVVAGQAASHCVKSTLEDLLDAIGQRDGALARRVYVLRDCMSSVAVPDPAREGHFVFDFTPETDRALARLAEAGMHVVDSTQPMSAWPGMEG
jgi:nicotinamidase-related amidase